jgi:putative membrane protein
MDQRRDPVTGARASAEAPAGPAPGPSSTPLRDDAGERADTVAVARPASVTQRAPFGPRTMATTYVSGFLMGSADLVPGVSGGTVALVVGIYERLVTNIRQGARGAGQLARGDLRNFVAALRLVEWSFLAPLLLGVLTAVVTLASALHRLLETQPVMLSGAFFGLIVGSVVVAYTELGHRTASIHAILVAAAAATFLLLGFRSGTFDDASLPIVFAGGALAVCAMILPGISGSFILLMLGLYEYVLGAVSDRELVTVGVFAAGAVVGLGAFSTLLHWLLVRFRDVVLAVLIGIMAGSLRVLWPWPVGADGVGTTTLGAPVPGEVAGALVWGVVGAVVVVVIARAARSLSRADD